MIASMSLLQAKEGGKQLKLTLLEVEYQPEAAGEYDR